MKLDDGSRVIHSIYFNLTDRTEEGRKRCIKACRRYLSQHPGIVKFSISTLAEDLRRSVNDQSFDVAMFIVFENRQAYDDYLDDPDHDKFLEETKSYVPTSDTRVFDSYGEGKPQRLLRETLIEELSAQVSGSVLQPGDGRYTASIRIDNGRVQRRPGVIVLPDRQEDIVHTLRFAIKHHLPFTIKGGGHSAAGYCLNDGGIVIDMKHLNAISFDERNQSVRVGMGARWIEVYEFMQATGTGFIPIGGGCPSVAPAGFIQGGGFSFVSRSYGMGIDNLLSLTILTADGERRVVGVHSKSEDDKDLFWACRGGGGGNFGVVVEMEMRVHKPRSEKMLVGQIQYPIDQAEDVLEYYNKWVETLPEEMAVYGMVKQQPDPSNPGKTIKTLNLTPVFNGTFNEGLDVLQDILRLSPSNVNLSSMTLPEWEEANGAATQVGNRSAYIRSLMLKPGAMTARVATVLMDNMDCAPSGDSFVLWTHAGGAISSKAPEETAFWHRRARFVPEVKAIWDPNDPDQSQKNIEWAYQFFEELAQASHASGAYVNYIDPLLHNWTKMYYGDNYERLERIKRTVDPENVFSFQQSIGSNFNPPKQKFDLGPLNRTGSAPAIVPVSDLERLAYREN